MSEIEVLDGFIADFELSAEDRSTISCDFSLLGQSAELISSEFRLIAGALSEFIAEFWAVTYSPQELLPAEFLLTNGQVHPFFGAEFLVTKFQPTPTPVTIQAPNATKLVPLDPIENAIYCNPTIISLRATAEIDAHRHVKIPYGLELGTVLPTMEPGDILRTRSDRRGKDTLGQVSRISITGKVSENREASLASTLTVNTYKELNR